MRRAAVALAALACIAPALHCGASAPRAATLAVDTEPRWEDAIDTTPELMVVLFPTALRKDRVYGPLLRSAIHLAREQSRVVDETRALDAMEDAEEVIVGVRPDPAGDAGPGGAAGEVIVVVRGVRADEDPAGLVDAEGHPLWAPGPSGRVRELVRSDNRSAAATPPAEAPLAATPLAEAPLAATPLAEAPVPASLFELPGRTWLIASGDARARARAAFARTAPSPHRATGATGLAGLQPTGTDSLAVLRIDGPSLVARVRALQPESALGALGQRLEAVTLELAAAGPPEEDAGREASFRRTIRASFSYADEDAAALAEATARDAVGAIARKRPDALVWLATASVDRPSPGGAPGKAVVVSAPLPPRLVADLLRAGAATLDAPPPPP